jgi:hypothetical protein
LFSLDEAAHRSSDGIPRGQRACSGALVVARQGLFDCPNGWKQSTSKGDAGSSYSFTAPDGKSEVRISAAYHISLPETMPDDVLGMAFSKERGITPITAIRGSGWDGLRCEYIDDTESTRWLGVAARHGSTVVLLTMKAPAQEFEHLRPTFQSVGESISFAQ